MMLTIPRSPLSSHHPYRSLLRSSSLRPEENPTRHDNRCGHPPKNELRLHPALHQCLAPGILGHRPHVVRIPGDQAGQRQNPEDDPEGKGKTFLQRRGLVLQVEIDQDRDGDDGEVDCQAEPAEEGALVGAVVAGVGAGVWEQQGREEGGGEEEF